MTKSVSYIFLLVLFLLNSCGKNQGYFVQDGDSYLFQGKDQIIITFSSVEPDIKLLDSTAQILSFINKNLPFDIGDNSILIEGLTDDLFVNFFTIADRLFFSTDQYKNKSLIYAYIASLYTEFSLSEKQGFIPLSTFRNIIPNDTINKNQQQSLLKMIVDYAVQDIFFVSVLELMERPQRYFFPQKTQEELFRVLIYPEIATLWEYMQFRFGKSMLFKYAQENYTPESWHVTFGEEISVTESAYVDQLKNNTRSISEEQYTSLTNSLQLYMTGTKKSLMKE